MTRAAVLSLSHGGGPLPVLGDPGSESIARSLRTKAPAVLRLDAADRPRAIVLVSAHWQRQRPTISTAAKPRLYYDYGGFPLESYKLKYDAPGSPEVAARVAELLREEGLEPDLDPERGWDHGLFVPMLLVRPQADIPLVAVSVLESEDPEMHYRMGRALGKLREENVAVVGSGFPSFHNINYMFSGAINSPGFGEKHEKWSRALTEATETEDREGRGERLKRWREWPGAYVSHPRGGADHFLPHIVCAGAAGDEKAKHYVDEFMGLDNIHSYYWE